jgi:predicted nucleic acid-binding protein
MGFVLDTNILNRIVDERFSLDTFPEGADLIASHIQIDEINNTSDADRRARLFLVLAKHVKHIVPTETAVADVSRFDNAKFGAGVLYNSIRAALDLKNRRKRNNIQDALIGEIALVHGHVLVTADEHLAEVMEEMGCAVMRVAA